MYCKSSTALRCKRLWPNRAADAPTCRIKPTEDIPAWQENPENRIY